MRRWGLLHFLCPSGFFVTVLQGINLKSRNYHNDDDTHTSKLSPSSDLYTEFTLWASVIDLVEISWIALQHRTRRACCGVLCSLAIFDLTLQYLCISSDPQRHFGLYDDIILCIYYAVTAAGDGYSLGRCSCCNYGCSHIHCSSQPCHFPACVCTVKWHGCAGQVKLLLNSCGGW